MIILRDASDDVADNAEQTGKEENGPLSEFNSKSGYKGSMSDFHRFYPVAPTTRR
jgi:hypothetical protein